MDSSIRTELIIAGAMLYFFLQCVVMDYWCKMVLVRNVLQESTTTRVAPLDPAEHVQQELQVMQVLIANPTVVSIH